MEDQPITKADFQAMAISTVLSALTDPMVNLTTQVIIANNNKNQQRDKGGKPFMILRCGNSRVATDFTNQMTTLINQIHNRLRDRGGGEPTRVSKNENSRAIIIENSSSDEE